LNFKWNPTDRLKLNFDVQKVEATQTNYDIETNLRSYADVTFDLTGDHPNFTIAPPSSFTVIGRRVRGGTLPSVLCMRPMSGMTKWRTS
jgi:hypothetical protein